MLILSLVMIVLFQTTYVLFMVGMLPSIIAWIADTSAGRHKFHTVVSCNLAGVLPFVVQLIAGHNSSSEMYQMLKDLHVMFIMWFSAAMGYLLFYMSPKVALLIISNINDRRQDRLKHVQEKLLQEWGTGIAFLDEEDGVRHASGRKD
jgi:hypothetical protein